MLDLNDIPSVRPAQRYDLDAIVADLRETAETWVRRHFPNGERRGDKWHLANILGDVPQTGGSCVIDLKGPRAGDWHEFNGSEGGGPISTIARATGLSGKALIAYAAELAGVALGAPARQASAWQPLPRRDQTPEIQFILSGAVPIRGTPVERYLSGGRRLELPDTADLLFHPNLTHWDSRLGYPAMIGVVRNCRDQAVALHRTYLAEQPDGRIDKADLGKPRLMLGPVAGGAVRLCPAATSTLALCEGIETGLAVLTALPGLAIWAALSTSGLEQIEVPTSVTRVLILADHDASGAGLRAAETAARRLRCEGRAVAIAIPPREGEDFNDLLLREGPDAVAEVIAASDWSALEILSPPIGRHLPLNFATSTVPRQMMQAGEVDLAHAVDKVWKIIAASNRTPWLFRHAETPTWVVPDDEGRAVAVSLTAERLQYILARLAEWRRLTSKGNLVPAPPPMSIVKSVLATPDAALPVLLAIVNTPVFGKNGSLLTTPGYHPDARLLYVPSPGFEVASIPARPSFAQIAAARELICEDLLGDFPFVAPAEIAHAVALLLLGFLRSMVHGPTPLHLIEKPAPGTGATLMVDAIATILTGAGASVMTEGRDDEEWRKRVTAKLRQIPTILLIDNLRQKLDSSAVAAALTASFWEDRILGQSEMARLPIRCLWIATGNNPEFSNEMARRLVRIRLNANVERPWQRSDFRHRDLLIWVRANRARLVHACLTLCQAWIAEGRPHGSRTIGSYESWAKVIGGVLDVVGIEGFLGNLEEMMETSDAEGGAWNGFIGLWWDMFGTAEVGSNDVLDLAIRADPKLPLGREGRTLDAAELGRGLSRIRDRVFDVDGRKLQLKFTRTLRRSQRWMLAVVG